MTVHGPNQRETMRSLRKALRGKWEKGTGYGDRFKLERKFGNGLAAIDLTIEGKRDEVCQRVVVGTETRTIPEVQYRPAETVTEDVVEWVCGNLLDD